ncbi:dTDP-4-dehydrorhamnose 3,5-epimerase family protein [Stutzerimonas kunmingensis]|uniref:dTDP-4-dehydrorhamnose 3,5-epimerase family protein n=1 Tax=Stutzerimonas kunmingensis TaxID=1211807 RepID=UPI0028A8C9CB|nr:dTDP-4-dehydrorhamnose 3,5-epimerase family protein [Stutzerimonas kunmingensis]
MKLTSTAIPDVVLIEPTVYEDERVWFMESFNEQRFYAELQKLSLPVPRPFVPDNHSRSKKDVLRGLHSQRDPHAQEQIGPRGERRSIRCGGGHSSRLANVR